MKRLRSLLAWLSLPTLAGLWLLFGSHTLEPPAPPAPDTVASPRYSLKGVQWTRLDAQGQREFTALADTADYFDDESAHYDQLRMNVPRNGSEPWRLTSPTGSVPAHEKRISMDGPVDISGSWPDGEAVLIQTPQLWVDPVHHQLDTQAGVTFNSDTRSGRANTLHADWSGQTLQLKGDVRMDYVPRK